MSCNSSDDEDIIVLYYYLNLRRRRHDEQKKLKQTKSWNDSVQKSLNRKFETKQDDADVSSDSFKVKQEIDDPLYLPESNSQLTNMDIKVEVEEFKQENEENETGSEDSLPVPEPTAPLKRPTASPKPSRAKRQRK